MSTVSRREVLVGAAAGALTLAGCGASSPERGRGPCAASTGRAGTSGGRWHCPSGTSRTAPSSSSCTARGAPPATPSTASPARPRRGDRAHPCGSRRRRRLLARAALWRRLRRDGRPRLPPPRTPPGRLPGSGRLPRVVDGRLRLVVAGFPARTRDRGRSSRRERRPLDRAGGASPGAFDDREDYLAHDVFSRTDVLAQIPVRLDCGDRDPFVAGNRAFAEALPSAELTIDDGGHTVAYWRSTPAASSSGSPPSCRLLATWTAQVGQ